MPIKELNLRVDKKGEVTFIQEGFWKGFAKGTASALGFGDLFDLIQKRMTTFKTWLDNHGFKKATLSLNSKFTLPKSPKAPKPPSEKKEDSATNSESKESKSQDSENTDIKKQVVESRILIIEADEAEDTSDTNTLAVDTTTETNNESDESQNETASDSEESQDSDSQDEKSLNSNKRKRGEDEDIKDVIYNGAVYSASSGINTSLILSINANQEGWMYFYLHNTKDILIPVQLLSAIYTSWGAGDEKTLKTVAEKFGLSLVFTFNNSSYTSLLPLFKRFGFNLFDGVWDDEDVRKFNDLIIGELSNSQAMNDVIENVVTNLLIDSKLSDSQLKKVLGSEDKNANREDLCDSLVQMYTKNKIPRG